MQTYPIPAITSDSAQLAEARGLARWAGGKIPNGPTAGALKDGYNIGVGDLDLAIAMIVARVRSEMASMSLGATRHGLVKEMVEHR